MIDTYFDRADAALGFRARTTWPADNPLHYRGALYASTTDAMTAQARDRLAWVIDRAYRQHSREMRLGIRPGHLGSLFTATGARK